MPNPIQSDCRHYHRDMACEHAIPNEPQAQYKDVCNLNMARGMSVGKVKGMRDLCKHMLTNIDAVENSVSAWKSVILQRAEFAEQSDNVRWGQSQHTWGIICGMHGGETAALSALQRGDS